MKCKICSGDATENGFCSLHFQAYKNVVSKFDVWRRASNVLWIDYLEQIQKNSLTGEWAKEVANYLIMEAKGNVK
jgi:hypothetical protein